MPQHFTTPYPRKTPTTLGDNYLASCPCEKVPNVCATCIWNTVGTCASSFTALDKFLTTYPDGTASRGRSFTRKCWTAYITSKCDPSSQYRVSDPWCRKWEINPARFAHASSLLYTVFALATLIDVTKTPGAVEAEEYYMLASAAMSLAPPATHTTLWGIHALVRVIHIRGTSL
jgi:hypothetical protein